MNNSLDNILIQWTSLGAGFNTRTTKANIDLERLIIQTAIHLPDMPRLYTLTATWLHIFGDMIARHRLKRLIRDELALEYHPILGLLLDTAQQHTHPLHFESIIKQLQPAKTPAPLFNASRNHQELTQLAKRKASDLSRKWNRWAQPITFKTDAIRPAQWLIKRYPILRTKADFLGDLRASIIAALQHDPNAGHSELKLAQCAGGSRAQIRNALHNLELTNRVQTQKAHGANRREIKLIAA